MRTAAFLPLLALVLGLAGPPAASAEAVELNHERRAALAEGKDHAIRMDVAKASALAGRLTWTDLERGEIEAEPERLGDVVLSRKEIPGSYHLAVVVDDAAQGVNLVSRGLDLFPASHLHRLLQALLGLPVPRWHHHGLVTDDAGRRLAKRHDALALGTLRAAGRRPQEVLAMAEAAVGPRTTTPAP